MGQENVYNDQTRYTTFLFDNYEVNDREKTTLQITFINTHRSNARLCRKHLACRFGNRACYI